MKRILLDQGLPATAALILREAAWDAVHVSEIAMHTATDVEILNRAGQESRVVVTLDRDFPQILALIGTVHPSVVLVRQQRLRGPDIAALLEAVWRDHEAALDKGTVIMVSGRGMRVRSLPLS